jgi:hypothetical protein
MALIRRTAAIVFLSGLVLGAITDTVPAREPVRAGGYEILAGDFHVHAFVGDGGLAPWVLQRQAARVGLDVIAITNHNQTLAGRLGRKAAARSTGPMVIVGEEITGRDFHLIAVGIEQPVTWDQPVSDAIDQVHSQGGVAIAAHPFYGFVEGYDRNALAHLDGVEVAHSDSLKSEMGLQLEEFYRRTLAENPGVAAIGSSDFHTSGPLGLCRTLLFVRERSQAGVLEAIREGRTVGRCGTDTFHGAPGLVRLVEPYKAALEPAKQSILAWVAVVAVWVSLLALALVGPRTLPDPRLRAESSPRAASRSGL